jgi:hypothetical protein
MNLEKLAAQLGFQEQSGVLSRHYKGYEVTLTSYKIPGAIVAIPMLLFVFNQALNKESRKAIAKVVKFKGFVPESIGLIDNAFLSQANFKNIEKVNLFLDQLTSTFEALGLKSLDYCPYCGLKETDGTRNVKGAVLHVHEACVDAFINKVSTHLETEGKSKEHLIQSVVLAMLGGVIGLIPSIILLVFTGIYSAWLFMLIPLAAFYGFKKGGAQKGSYVMILIAIISLILAPGFMFYVYYSDAMYYNVLFSDYLAVDGIRAAFIKDMTFSVLFTLISLGVSWKQIYKQTLGQIKKDIEALKK